MYKSLMFGAYVIVITQLAYRRGLKKGRDNQRYEYYYHGYELGKFVGELNEKYREKESE